jgi:hypothetical protein
VESELSAGDSVVVLRADKNSEREARGHSLVANSHVLEEELK